MDISLLKRQRNVKEIFNKKFYHHLSSNSEAQGAVKQRTAYAARTFTATWQKLTSAMLKALRYNSLYIHI